VIPRRVVPLAPGEEHPLGKGRVLRAFETFHRVPSQGYTVWERRDRLRSEFRGLPGPRLGELRRQGVALDETHEVARLSFTGDTRVEVLERTPELQHTECLVIEASFLNEVVPTAEAREMGHIHLDELIERAALLPRTDVVFSHFSARYRAEDVRDILAQRLPDALRETVRSLPAGLAA
jgi:ribonuclease Z